MLFLIYLLGVIISATFCYREVRKPRDNFYEDKDDFTSSLATALLAGLLSWGAISLYLIGFLLQLAHKISFNRRR